MTSSLTIHVVVRAPECLPSYASNGAAGIDLKAYIETPMTLACGTYASIPTGLFIEVPFGYEAQVRPRSGLAAKYGVTILNAPGTIDSDYRGEIAVVLINHGSTPFVITPFMRIAQLVIAPVIQAHLHPVVELTPTQRGSGGFGHTGI